MTRRWREADSNCESLSEIVPRGFEVIATPEVEFAMDSPQEGGVYCELVSEVGFPGLVEKAGFQGVMDDNGSVETNQKRIRVCAPLAGAQARLNERV